MDDVVNPQMLIMVRDAKGWTQRDLARRSGLSQSLLSKVENGLVDLSGSRLRQIAGALDCPPELLARPSLRVGTAMTCLHHRRRHSRMTAGSMRRIEGITHLTRVSVEALLDALNLRLDTDLLPLPGQDPRIAAQSIRRHWSMEGHVPDLTSLLEARGVLIVTRAFGSRSQDAVSSWPADAAHPPIIVVNEGLTPDRYRFTIAHELAHLVLHAMPSEDQELEANAFAGEFLVPAQEIAPILSGLTTADFRKLADLKADWRVSIGMLVQRARDVGAISERQFREFRMRLTRLGWDVNEPGALAAEQPQLLRRIFDIAREEFGYDDDKIASLALMTTASFRRHYLNETPHRRVLSLDAGQEVVPTLSGPSDDPASVGPSAHHVPLPSAQP